MITNSFTRKLGYYEESFIQGGCNVITIAHTSGHIFNIETLNKALNLTIDSHPNLRINWQPGTDIWKEIHDPYITAEVIKTTDTELWKNISKIEINKEFTYSLENTLFNFLIIVDDLNTHLMIKYHHAIGDGVSGMILINTILTYYTKLLKNDKFEITKLPFLTDSETLSFPNGLTEDQNNQTKEIKELLVKYHQNTQNVTPYYSLKNNPNSPLFADGTEENFKNVRSWCKQVGVTVGSVVISSIYFAVAKQVNWNETNEINFPINVDVNLRDRLINKLGYSNVGLIISIMTMYDLVITKETTFLELCKAVNNNLKNKFDTNYHLLQKEAEKLIEPIELEKITFNCNINISNIGAYPFDNVYQIGEDESIILTKINCVGGIWSPYFGIHVFLLHSIKFFSYSFVYTDSIENEIIAKNLFDDIINLIELCYYYEKMKFKDFIK